jgi:PAS domain S-box-containing protein/putative nucleotidyltransferase with HDIG domain
MFSTQLVIGICFVVFTTFGMFIWHLLSSHKKVINSVESLTEHVTNIPIQSFTKDGIILLWNRASELTYGYQRKDVIGKKITDILLVEGEATQFMENVAQVYATNKPLPPRQWIMMTRNGHKRAIYSTMFPYIKDGVCESIFCIEVDITDIKNYEDGLTSSLEKYKSIFEGVNEAIYVIDPVNNKIIHTNRKASQLSEYSKEELTKLSIEDLSYGDKEVLSKRIKAMTAKAFYEGEQHFEWLLLKKSGEVFEVEISMQKGVVDQRECVFATVRDISQRKRTEENLKASEKRYSDLLRNTSSLIFSLDDSGLITSVNSAANKVLKYKKDDILGHNFLEFLPEDQHEKARNMFKEIKNGKDKDEELRCITRDKEEIVILLNAWPMCDKNDKIIGIYGVAKDITEQKKTLERMRQMIIQIVSMLSETVSVADRYTEDHCERLQEFSLKIGAELALNEEQMEHLKFAALLHDVGKVGVPIHILLKKGKLTEEEWNAIKEHPKKGADIVRQLSGFEDVALIIEQHQERIDGKGYPLGLKKDQIKKEATIISVVDAFDAMTSDRPYRKAMSIEEAIKELEKNAGSQFDKQVVEAFITILKKEAKTKPNNPPEIKKKK